ncbi:hypothetical protein KEM09_19285 [Carboxylicivirga mesophila]|uniref:Uncharacterized protein n=1 Tax=Carboxylicivirga mesophila TaxID=1166478 RepID=A0ABS5KEY0_9BACT|nr:hypothetical protein [Carboxylicivirga mesophila]MBS2213560.1 hypothetical protein [Carboxylicivirga mesophila]
MGYYDWEKILKNKSSKELFDIYSGKTHIDEEARGFAEAELKKRDVNTHNIEKHKKKWILDQLIEEEREENRGLGFSFTDTFTYLLMGFLGIVFTFVQLLDIHFEFIESTKGEITLLERAFFLTIGPAMTIIGFYTYKRRKKRKIYRDNEIKELIDKL